MCNGWEMYAFVSSRSKSDEEWFSRTTITEQTMKYLHDRSRRSFLRANSMLALTAIVSPGTIAEAFADSKSKTTRKEETITWDSEQAADKIAIRPFYVKVPETEITELRRRIKATKWPERELVTGASQGVQHATMQKLAHFGGRNTTGGRLKRG